MTSSPPFPSVPLVALAIWCCAACGEGSLTSAAPPSSAVEVARPDGVMEVDWREVMALGDASPARRELARHRLRERGVVARSALLAGLESPSLEIRTTSRRMLAEIEQTVLNRSLARLLRGDHSAVAEQLPAWHLLRDLIGDSQPSRQLYADLLQQHPRSLYWLESHLQEGQSAETQSSDGDNTLELDRYVPLDPQRMNQGDPVRWALVLLVASQTQFSSVPVLTSRVRGGLLSPVVQQRLLESQHRLVLQKLVGRWLSVSAHAYVNATMLKIAMAYQCDEVADTLVAKTLDNPHATPTSVATSLVLLTRLQPHKARQALPAWVNDGRVCHVWQVVTARRRAVQTQVGDVAVALLLHLDEHDPRQFGYVDLQADPQLIFREFSMGFEDDTARQSARRQAANVLDIPRLVRMNDSSADETRVIVSP